MPTDQFGDEFITVIDNLDLSSNAQRRVAVYALEEFIGGLMTRVGREWLHEKQPYHQRNLIQQWDAICGWFETEDIAIPGEYSDLIGKLKSLRDEVAHNYLSGVDRALLEEIIGKADEIRSWLIESGQVYYNEVEKHSQLQAIEKRTEQILNRILGQGEVGLSFLDDRLSEVKTEANDLYAQLNEISRESPRRDGRIPAELVNVLQRSQELDHEVWYIVTEAEDMRRDSHGVNHQDYR